jgi:hypothetical protein
MSGAWALTIGIYLQQTIAKEEPNLRARHTNHEALKRQPTKMWSIGNYILVAGIAIVIVLCWAWLPCFLMVQPFRRVGNRKQGDILPIRATEGEVRYRAEGFVPPPEALSRNPQAFDPEARHHEYLKVDPRLAEQLFQTREARDEYEATFGLGRAKNDGGRRPPGRESRKKSAASATQGANSGVQEPAPAVICDRQPR